MADWDEPGGPADDVLDGGPADGGPADGGELAAGPAVTYEFPVEIEIIGDLDGPTLARIAEHVFAQLDRELSSRL